VSDRPAVRPTLGYLCVVAATALWAMCGVAGKLLFTTGLTPLALVQVRVTLSAALMLPLLLVVDRSLLRISLSDLRLLVALGLAMTLCQVGYFVAVQHIQVAAGILLQYLSPVLIALFAVTFWGERLSAVKVGALALSVLGCALVSGAYDLDLLALNRVGVLAGLGSAVAFATSSLLSERAMHRLRPLTVLFYAMVAASLAMHLLQPPFRYLTAGWDAQQWGWIAYTAVGGTIAPFVLYFVGIGHLRATRANLTATLEPAVAALLAFLLLGEVLAWPQLLGGAAVIAAVGLLQLGAEPDDLTPARIRAAGGRR